MTTIDPLPNTAHVDIVRYTPPFSAICSVTNHPYWGTVEIVYYPAETLLEFTSFEGWLKSLGTHRLTIEDLCRLVFDTLREALGDISLSVTVHAQTTEHAPVSTTIRYIKEANHV